MDEWMHSYVNEKLHECMNVSEDCARELEFILSHLNLQTCTGHSWLYNILATLEISV